MIFLLLISIVLVSVSVVLVGLNFWQQQKKHNCVFTLQIVQDKHTIAFIHPHKYRQIIDILNILARLRLLECKISVARELLASYALLSITRLEIFSFKLNKAFLLTSSSLIILVLVSVKLFLASENIS